MHLGGHVEGEVGIDRFEQPAILRLNGAVDGDDVWPALEWRCVVASNELEEQRRVVVYGGARLEEDVAKPVVVDEGASEHERLDQLGVRAPGHRPGQPHVGDLWTPHSGRVGDPKADPLTLALHPEVGHPGVVGVADRLAMHEGDVAHVERVVDHARRRRGPHVFHLVDERVAGVLQLFEHRDAGALLAHPQPYHAVALACGDPAESGPGGDGHGWVLRRDGHTRAALAVAPTVVRADQELLLHPPLRQPPGRGAGTGRLRLEAAARSPGARRRMGSRTVGPDVELSRPPRCRRRDTSSHGAPGSR